MTLMGEEVLPSRRTCCVRLERNECTQLSDCGDISCCVSGRPTRDIDEIE